MNTKQLLITILLLGSHYVACIDSDMISDAEKLEYCQKTPQYRFLSNEECKAKIIDVNDETRKFNNEIKSHKRRAESEFARSVRRYEYKKKHMQPTNSTSKTKKELLAKYLYPKKRALRDLLLAYSIKEYTENTLSCHIKKAKTEMEDHNTEFYREANDTCWLVKNLLHLDGSSFGRRVLKKMRTNNEVIYYYIDNFSTDLHPFS